MENLYLIIIAFVFGVLIYTILPKICGCDKVLEGHGDHTHEEKREIIYHILNSIVYKENGTYTIDDILQETWEEIWSSKCVEGGNKIYNQVRQRVEGGGVICSDEGSYDISSGDSADADTLERLIIILIYNLEGEIISDQHNYNLNVNVPYSTSNTGDPTQITDVQKQNLVKLAKVANLLIEIHSNSHNNDPTNHIVSVLNHLKEDDPTLMPYYQGLGLDEDSPIYSILAVPVNCIGIWSPWSQCAYNNDNNTCVKTKTFSITQESSNGGINCTVEDQEQRTTTDACPGSDDANAPPITNCPGYQDPGLVRYCQCITPGSTASNMLGGDSEHTFRYCASLYLGEASARPVC